MIESIIDEVLKTGRVSSGDDLTGFVIDTDYALSDQEIFTTIDVQRTDDPRSLVNAKIEVRDGVPAIQEISKAFAAAWQRIAYTEFQACSIVWYREATILRFITTSSRGLCVTGTFVARSNDYGRLVDQFNRDFGSITSPLRSFPGGLPAWAAG